MSRYLAGLLAVLGIIVGSFYVEQWLNLDGHWIGTAVVVVLAMVMWDIITRGSLLLRNKSTSSKEKK